jgi:hemerythrin superfamily protein
LEITPADVGRANFSDRCEPFATGTKPPTGGWRGMSTIKEMPMTESRKTPDAVALLKADHREVEELFAKYEKASGEGRKQKLAEQICMELTVHAKIEEEIFYPACEGKVEEDLLKEAYVEHDAAKLLIAQIEAGGPGDEFYDAKVKVLQEEIEHHVEEEEKRVEGIFAQGRKAGLDMDALGEQLAARKAELTATYKKSGLPTPELTTMGA